MAEPLAGIGPQNNSTTEDGAYTLTAQGISNSTVSRNGNWQWAVAGENEWYKAAYYDPNKAGGAGYWLYPTGTSSVPSNDLLTPDGGNNANFYQSSYAVGSPYYRTPVGEFENSDSPYGTFDQGGNVWEWNEAIPFSSYRGLRGGSFGDTGYVLQSSYRDDSDFGDPANEYIQVGLRVVQVPEPATIMILALASVGILRRKKA